MVMARPAVLSNAPIRPGLASPVAPDARIRAVLFDLDGTLYDQSWMRRLMAMELLAFVAGHPFGARWRLRGLREYRRAQEALRHEGRTGHDLAETQLRLAAERAGVSSNALAPIVAEWMQQRPLKHLSRCRAEGLNELFDFLRNRQVHVGVFSDYPAHEKLRALRVADHCSPVLCATDPAIGAFKPDPRGFLAACVHWNLPAAEVLMVGDRAEVDATGARAAGMPCVLIGPPATASPNPAECLVLPSLERLHRVLDAGR